MPDSIRKMRTFLLLSLILSVAAVPFASADERKHPWLVEIGGVMTAIGFPGLVICGLITVIGSI